MFCFPGRVAIIFSLTAALLLPGCMVMTRERAERLGLPPPLMNPFDEVVIDPVDGLSMEVPEVSEPLPIVQKRPTQTSAKKKTSPARKTASKATARASKRSASQKSGKAVKSQGKSSAGSKSSSKRSGKTTSGKK